MLPILLIMLLTGLQPAPPRPAPDDATGAARATGAAVTALRGDLERLIEGPAWRNDRWSVIVVSLDRGDTIFAHQPDAALAPASNMKLFTSAAALYYLGPDFRYSTYVLSTAPIEAGTLRGDLILYGTGDPTLSGRFYATKTTVWEEFADSLAALGIRTIAGDVVGDASYFGGPAVGAGWEDSYRNTWYAAPASALSYNENIVTLHIEPGERVGWRPQVQLIPGGRGIAIVNLATTVGGGRTRIHVDRAAYDGPIVIRGRIRAGSSGVWRAVPVADPARFAATVFREVLEKRGIRVLGGVRSVYDPAESPLTGRTAFATIFGAGPPLHALAVHRSLPLVDILEFMNKESHNLFAEQVLRTVGRVALGDGSIEGGSRAVHYLLECETDLDSLVLHMADGSGLSVLNRVSARTAIDLLAYMARSPVWNSFWVTLPEAGAPDGLRRMYRTRAEGNLRAKTGTIDNVSALSGYVRAQDGEWLAFSIISNNVPSTWRAKRIEDAIGARLAAFDRPAAPLLGSAPAAQRRPIRVVSDESPRAHVIRKGDTLEEIAKTYGTTITALEAANPGIDPRRLIPGRKVRLR